MMMTMMVVIIIIMTMRIMMILTMMMMMRRRILTSCYIYHVYLLFIASLYDYIHNRKHPSLKLLLPESLRGGIYSDLYKQYQYEQWQPIVNLPSTLKSVVAVVTSQNNNVTTTTTTTTTKTIIANDNTMYDYDNDYTSSSITSLSINQFESNSKVCLMTYTSFYMRHYVLL